MRIKDNGLLETKNFKYVFKLLGFKKGIIRAGVFGKVGTQWLNGPW